MIPLTTEKFNFYTFIKINKQVKQFLPTLSIPSFRSGMIEREREDVTHVSRCHAAVPIASRLTIPERKEVLLIV